MELPVRYDRAEVERALAACCTMALKPTELTPSSVLAPAMIVEGAGVPAGVFNVVAGPPEAIGEILSGDPRIRKFAFTGLTSVGNILAALCAEPVKRLSAAAFFGRTVIMDVRPDALLCWEETFGPVTGLTAQLGGAGSTAFFEMGVWIPGWSQRRPRRLEESSSPVTAAKGSKYGMDYYLELKTTSIAVRD